MYKHICSRLMQNVYYDDVQKLLRQKYKKKPHKGEHSFCNYSQIYERNMIMIMGLQLKSKVNMVYHRIHIFSFHECPIQKLLCTNMQDNTRL